MASSDLKNFLKALETAKQDYTCMVCSELCKNPVTLSKCFHIICGSHFESLKYCPNCNTSLEGCTTFSDDRLESCIESAKELNKIFEGFKSKDLRLSNTNVSIPDSGAKRKQKAQKVETSKENKSVEANKVIKTPTEKNSGSKKEVKSKNENLDISLPSNLSASKIVKAIEKKNNKGETMLHIACRLGKLDKVMEFLNQGANTNTKDNAGWTPLHEAVQIGNIELVRILLQYNTLIDVPGQGNETPLHEAVRYNHIEIAEELVKNGANINAKNCKGETPIELANGKMKEAIELAAENIIHTQSLNIHNISVLQSELDCDDIRIYSISEYRTVSNKLKSLVKHHSNLHIEAKFTKKVTHLLVDADDSGISQASVEVMQGIVNAIWIISSQWVLKSSDDKLEPFENYEVKGVGTSTSKGPKNARYNKYKQLPGLFDGCHFYFHNFNAKYEVSKTVVLTKAILTKLVTDAGGIVLRRVPNPESIPDSEKLVPYHAKKDGKLVICSHYIIFKDMYEPMYNMKHLKALPVGWLIECIEKYELCEPW